MKAIIIGSTRGVRRIDPSKSYPLILSQDTEGKRIFDWIHGSLTNSGISDIIIVGGYHIEKLILEYPQFKYYYDQNWKKNGAFGSLFSAKDEIHGSCLIITPDVVFNSSAIKKMSETKGNIVFSVMNADLPNEKCCKDEQGLKYSSELCGFSGIIKLSETGAEAFIGHYDYFLKNSDRLSLSDYLQSLQKNGIKLSSCYLGNDISKIDDSLGFSRFVLRSKAETLENIQGRLKNACVLDQIRFTQQQWIDNPYAIVETIINKFKTKKLVIRSSASSEDSWSSSQAGKFHSELSVPCARDAIIDSINIVISHYKDDSSRNENQVFVQEHLIDVKLAGVLFTRDLETGAPYYVVNYDSTTGTTDSITAGFTDQITTSYFVKKTSIDISTDAGKLISTAGEIEALVGHDALDIEYAIDKNEQCYIFQVRPIVFKNKDSLANHSDFYEEIFNAEKAVQHLLERHHLLSGKTNVLGNMPDWNPAEMIGDTPHPLSISLYSYLITDYTWAKSRAAVGYKNVFPCALMHNIAGHPYIDCRASFNSFLPQLIPDEISEKIVSHYIRRLSANPELHDKVEFKVAITCYTPDFDQLSKQLLEDVLTKGEIETFKKELKILTNNILSSKTEPIQKQIDQISLLAKKRELVLSTNPSTLEQLSDCVSALLDDCTYFGTLPFSILARYAFISTSILNSLERSNVIKSNELEVFLTSIPTVASELSIKLSLLCQGKLSKKDFLDEFGHLRPGTYDINSYSYSEAFDQYFYLERKIPGNQELSNATQKTSHIFKVKSKEINRILNVSGIQIDADQLYDFIVKSIQGREYAKFEFTKNISCALKLIERIGDLLGVSRKDMAYIPVKYIFEMKNSSIRCGYENDLRRIIETNKKRHNVTQAINLPHIIISTSDVTQYEINGCHPNFISSKCINAPVVNLDSGNSLENLEDKIVILEKADPGYDWIFSYNIAGLITKYGGAASHMAIRAAEFGLPAAIGCGELLFKKIAISNSIELNCSNKKITILE